MGVQLLNGDCREGLKTLVGSSVDSIVTDPPYDLTAGKKGGSGAASVNLESPYGRSRIGVGNGAGGFMGMRWDGTGVAFDAETWRQALRVLKPGGYLLAFGGTRTYHRLVCAIEDAGFEIRDQIGWAFGSGFPKSHNGAWGGTALKPAWEPICMARKPLDRGLTVAENFAKWGTGALNIDGCRVLTSDDLNGGAYAEQGLRSVSGSLSPSGMNLPGKTTGKAFEQPLGRWPANLIHDGSDEVLAAFPQSTSVGHTPAARGNGGVSTSGHGGQGGIAERHHDTGSAARFFYCAKASKADRGEGNTHPTVKPTDLMRYLCRLVTPPGGTVLDPFTGSGSTLKAAELEGFEAIGIELDPVYIDIARRRIAADMPLFAQEIAS
jgi:site-specific DNA-methyltransferase (adenine-specific)